VPRTYPGDVEHAVTFALLGPLAATVDGVLIDVGGPRQRLLLAVLLDRRNTVVPRSRLIAALWDDEPPDSAEAALHNAVSQLRRALEPKRASGEPPHVLETHAGGYLLRVAAEAVDVDVVGGLRVAAADAADTGRTAAAAEAIERALGLWRGESLSDLTATAARSIATELDGLRIDLEEDLADIYLALGRHRDVTTRIGPLVQAYPLRTRLRGQLMLALFRAGRPQEALASYRNGYRAFAALGLEPDAALRQLERAIISQDPALAGSAPAPSPDARRHRRRWPALAGVAVVVAAGGAFTILGDRDGSPVVTAAQDRVLGIDVRTGEIVAAHAVGRTPTSVAADASAVWVLNADDATITRVDLDTGGSETFGAGGVPTDLAAGEGAVWVANGRRQEAQFVGAVADQVSRIDAASHALTVTSALPRRRGLTSNVVLGHLAVTSDTVWAIGPDYRVIGLDPATAQVTIEIEDVLATAIAAGDAGVWAIEADGALARIDAAAGPSRPRVRLPGGQPDSIAVGGGAVWATDPVTGYLWRVDPAGGATAARSTVLAPGIAAVAADARSVWVANALDGTISQIDPTSGARVGELRPGGIPRRLAVAGDRLWATTQASPPVSASGLPTHRCGEVIYEGPGAPDALVVSDLPMRAGLRVPMDQLRDAIVQVLAQHGFEAGGRRIGYQACDDSTGERGIYDEQICIANARLYAATPRVIGVIGPYNSGCAAVQIPIANAAPDGPLAMVSPTASLPSLTIAPAPTLRERYPTGVRSFARIFPADDVLGAALAREAAELGATRALIISDGSAGGPAAEGFVAAAPGLGVEVAGVLPFAPGDDPAGVAAGAAQLAPDVVVVAVLLDSGLGELVRELRAAFGPEFPLLATDGALPVSVLFARAGDAARGVRVAVPGIAIERLGVSGQRFANQFAATHGGRPPDFTALYAAAATEVLLAAIDHSDGTRSSAARSLPGTSLADSVVGPIRIGAGGDAVPAAVTIVRAVQGGGSEVVLSSDGADVERVVRIP
jgi:DNA-binding SARP family transcriptional activator/ABC-type branched-subunit amino acid transport system substrate-binding protein/DNA-binding beta-propeller fold protein YncE